MRFRTALISVLPLFLSLVSASPYSDELAPWNINSNKDATDPTQYSTTRKNTTYTPSPDNWRSLPTYTLLLDKFADGDPSNNDFFGTMFENDWRETQLRFGGDLKGLVARLDYLQGMGIKMIFISGTPFLNMLWQADSERTPSPSLHSSGQYELNAFVQVTPRSTLPYLTLIGEPGTTGSTPLPKFMLVVCTLWPTLQWEQ